MRPPPASPTACMYTELSVDLAPYATHTLTHSHTELSVDLSGGVTRVSIGLGGRGRAWCRAAVTAIHAPTWIGVWM